MRKKNNLTESRIVYDSNHKERMNPALEQQYRNREHSLGPHPAFPEGDDQNFEEKIMSKRFNDLIKNYKRQFDVSSFNNNDVPLNTFKHLKTVIDLEDGHHDELVDIAIDLVREEFDISEEDLIINAEITYKIDATPFQENYNPRVVEDIEFEDHKSIQDANKEVVKRRLINAMIQGSAKKCSHMFHEVEDKITELNPRLNTNYSKLMAGADLHYFLISDDGQMNIPGGAVSVEFPKNEGEPATINAKAVTFPILVHEIVKGVMEVLSANGLPEDPKITEFVLAKADFTSAEPSDMRLGVGLWSCFTECIDYEDFDLKHHIYAELVSLPVDEFNDIMKEIFAGTKRGKDYVKELANDIREEIRKDEFNSSLINDDFGDDDYFSPDEFDDINPDFLL